MRRSEPRWVFQRGRSSPTPASWDGRGRSNRVLVGEGAWEVVHRLPHTVPRAFLSDVIELQQEKAFSNQEGLRGGPSTSR